MRYGPGSAVSRSWAGALALLFAALAFHLGDAHRVAWGQAAEGGPERGAAAEEAASGGGAFAEPEAAIPAGRDDFLADMLGRGATLPGGCAFAGGGVERTSVTARYACAGGEVVLRLVHPGVAPAAAPHSERFAVVHSDGAPPPGLVEALLERIRAREGSFEWIWPRGPMAAPRRLPLLPIAVLAGALVLWLAWRRRRKSAAR